MDYGVGAAVVEDFSLRDAGLLRVQFLVVLTNPRQPGIPNEAAVMSALATEDGKRLLTEAVREAVRLRAESMMEPSDEEE